MKLTLLGYGKMGQTIHKLLTQFTEIELISIIDSAHPNATHTEISTESLADTNLVIDFTHPTVAISNTEKILEINPKIKIVMGTTGWYDDTEYLKNLITQKLGGFLYTSNFSIGVHQFWKLVEHASKQFANFSDEYDVFGHEYHHNQKADSPSGTAKVAAETILANFPAKKTIQYETSHEKIDPTQLHYTSTRGGNIPGTHSVFFDSMADTIEITHTARNREGFALGAIKCALWLQDKVGFYTIEDYLNS